MDIFRRRHQLPTVIQCPSPGHVAFRRRVLVAATTPPKPAPCSTWPWNGLDL